MQTLSNYCLAFTSSEFEYPKLYSDSNHLLLYKKVDDVQYITVMSCPIFFILCTNVCSYILLLTLTALIK